MKFLLALFVCVLAACGPSDYSKTSKSDLLSESAVVRKLIYQPAQEGKIDGTISYNPFAGEHESSLRYHPSRTTHISAVYAIVFECQHGTFDIDDREDIWKKLHEGDSVVISYREVYRTHVHYVDPDNKPDLTEETKELIDLEFVDANPIEVR